MNLATYHTDVAPTSRRLTVLKKNPDGTVDLGRIEDGKKIPFVTRCPVSTEVKVGSCILDAEEVEASKPTTKTGKAAAKAAAKKPVKTVAEDSAGNGEGSAETPPAV
jgi:hypothetical protein